MKKSESCKKILEKILANQEFDRLESFADSKKWESLSEDERELLSLLFVMRGEKQLLEGDNKIFESYRYANLITPNNPSLLYRQAIAFSNQSNNQLCLETACKIFETVTELQPDFFDAWHGWANALAHVGSMNQDSGTLLMALKKYSKAESLADKVETIKLTNLYRDQGLCWHFSGTISGEPQDFRNAIGLYQKAARLGLNNSFFWNDYGNAINEIAQLVNKPALIHEAVEMYWKSIKLSSSNFAGWYNLAASLKVLYQIDPREVYYKLANQSFEEVTKIEPHNSMIWSKWGELQAFCGRICKDIEKLYDSCKKFEIADICEPNDPIVLSSWAESLLQIGSWNEDLDILKDALDKIHKSLELQQDIPRIWFLCGYCLNELGSYYKDEDYFQEAIEKFQVGLQLDPSDPLLWYGLSLSFFALGQMHDDIAHINQALEYCEKAVVSGGENFPQLKNDWGLILIKLANMTDDKKYLDLAIQKFEQIIQLSTKSGVTSKKEVEWWYNLGCAYEFLGDLEEDTAIFEKALNVFKKVVEIDPAFDTVYFNLACVYSRLGELTLDIDFFFEANMFFEKACKIDPEDDQVWNEWGISFLNIAELTNDPVRPDISQKFYSEAEEKLFQSASLGNTSATYHLACLYSLTENFETSIYFLKNCKENDALPPIEDLYLDEWLEKVRQTPLFLHFLSQIAEKEY